MKPTYTSFDFQENTLALGIYLTGLPKGAGKVLPSIPLSCKPAVLTDISLEVVVERESGFVAIGAGEVFLPVDYIPSDYASGTGPRNLVSDDANRKS